MGIFYLNISTVSRSAGRSAIAAAAYCSRSRLHDDRLEHEVDFSKLQDLEHSEILLPSGAPYRWLDRSVLWNEVESIERREDAQLGREIEIALPVHLSDVQSVNLAREFLVEEFVESGMIVDFNILRASASDGRAFRWVHGLFTMREIVSNAFGTKRTDWKDKKLLQKWRDRWSQLSNKYLIEAGYRHAIGAGADAVSCRRLDALPGEVGSSEYLETAWRNGERLSSEPGLALEALTRDQSSFERAELTDFIKKNTATEEQYGVALARVETAFGLVCVGEDKFSTRKLMGRAGGESLDSEAAALKADDSGSEETASERTLEASLALWEKSGRRVRGVGLTYELAKAFEKKTGIKSVAVHGLLGRWMKKQDLLAANDVLVVNDVRSLTPRQREWMLKAARAVKARLVLIVGERVVEIDGEAIGLDVDQLALMEGPRVREPSRRSAW